MGRDPQFSDESVDKLEKAKKEYEQSEKGKKKNKNYRQSDKGKATTKKYQEGEKFKLTQKKYYESESGRDTQLRRLAKNRVATRLGEYLKDGSRSVVGFFQEFPDIEQQIFLELKAEDEEKAK